MMKLSSTGLRLRHRALGMMITAIMVASMPTTMAFAGNSAMPRVEMVDKKRQNVDTTQSKKTIEIGNLFHIDAKGKRTQLTKFGRSYNAVISPNGRYVAFVDVSDFALEAYKGAFDSDIADTSSLWVYDLANGTRRNLIAVGDFSSGSSPVFSGDSRVVFFEFDIGLALAHQVGYVPVKGGPKSMLGEYADLVGPIKCGKYAGGMLIAARDVDANGPTENVRPTIVDSGGKITLSSPNLASLMKTTGTAEATARQCWPEQSKTSRFFK